MVVNSPAATHAPKVRQKRIEWSRRDPSTWVFAGLLAVGFVLVLRETRGLSFFGDEWDFVVNYRGLAPSTLLHPHGPHLVLVPILIYKVLLHVFGAGSYLPFRLLAAFDLVLLAAILGVVCRRAWGRWWGLLPVLLLVTLGPGSISTLWPFQTGYAISVAAGLGSLLVLSRRGRVADFGACALLLISLACGSQGVGFVVGAAVLLGLRGELRPRAWVVVVPAVLYFLWYLEYGRQASETHLSLWSSSLVYIMQALSATLGPLLGLSSVVPQTGTLDTSFGQPLALAAVAGLIFALWRGWRPPPLVWAVLVTAVVLWIAASLSNTAAFARPAQDPRYLATDAVLLLVCLCLAVPRPRLTGVGAIAAVIVLIVIAATNASQYGQTRNFLRTSDIASRAELGALLILRGVVGPDFSPDQPGLPGILVNVRAGTFFSAVDSFGVTGDSPAMLLKPDAATRQGVDAELQRGEMIGLTFRPLPGAPSTAAPAVLFGSARTDGNCLVLGSHPVVIRAPAGSYGFAAQRGVPLSVAIGRFADDSVQLGQVPPGRTATARVPADRAPQYPWRMWLTGSGARVCSLAS
jgi:hypothetical protein